MRRAELAVALAAALVFLVGLGARDFWEPDEPRHGAIAEEMRELRHGPGQLVVPRLNDEPYSQKPPLYYWLAAGAGVPRGIVTEGAARLPSALAALLTVLVVHRFGRSALGAAAGLGAAAVLVTVPAFVDIARNARPDALLTCFVAIAFWMAWRLDREIGDAAWNRRALHLAMGLGLLTKGPVAFFLPLLGHAAYLAWERRLRDFGRLFSRGSLLLSVGVAVAWLGAALWITPQGFFQDAVTDNLVGRYFSGASHEQPLLFYLKRLPVSFLPWALLWPFAVMPLRAGLRHDADPERRRALRLLLAFVGAGFVFFTLSAGKRVLYLMPLFPALALLSTEGLRSVLVLARRVPRGAAFRLVAACVALAAALLAAFAGTRAGLSPAAVGIALTVAAVIVAVPWERVFAAGPLLARGFVLGVAAQVAVFSWLLPRLDPGHSIRAAAVAASAFAPEGTSIGLLRNGSLVGGIAYYSGRPVLPVGGEEGVARFVAAGGRALILETPHLPAIQKRLRPRIVFRQIVDDDEILVVVIDDSQAVAAARLPGVDRESRGPVTARRAAAVALVALAAALWILPSDVPRLIARQRDVLLGRYAEGHFVAAVLVTLLAVPVAAMVWRRVPALEIAMRCVLAVGSGALAFAVASILAYRPSEQRYLETPVAELVGQGLAGATRRRQPNERFELKRRDEPGPARSYPGRPPGFPDARVALTTDANGLRNPVPVERCDVVVTGDSFSEGSMVDDGEVWSARLAERTALRVRNVAMSGASPRHALNNLAAFGVGCAPRVIVASVYEGNDFKRHPDAAPLPGDRAGPPSLGARIGAWRRLAFEDSPLRFRAKRWLLGTLGPVRADAPVAPSPGLDWMPVRVAGRAYAFEPKELVRLALEPERFERSREWTDNAGVYREMAAFARARGAALLLVYAPSKARVVLPAVRNEVDPTALRAFAAFEEDDLPDADRFAEELYDRLETIERVFFAFCADEGIACESLTEPLRSEVSAGRQAYFSYDPHWTRLGHEAVAARVADRIARERWLAAEDRATLPAVGAPPGAGRAEP